MEIDRTHTKGSRQLDTFPLNFTRGMPLLLLSEQLKYCCGEETRLGWVQVRMGKGWRHQWMSASFSGYWTMETLKERVPEVERRGRTEERKGTDTKDPTKGKREWDQMCKWNEWYSFWKEREDDEFG